MKITKNATRKSIKGPTDWFTGNVRLEMLFTEEDIFRTSGGQVTFEPGARTAWHTHPVGQMLVVLSGVGRVCTEGGEIQEIQPGDVVWFPAGEKHWHGASPDAAMSHIAIQESEDGSAVEWLEQVSDEEYSS